MSLVAIVGRPNVGKSTLFNRLVGQRKAIVDATAGTTRDRHYGKTDWNGREFSVIDTGGYTVNSEDIFEDEIRRQVLLAIDEADVILFLVEVKTGITDLDIHNLIVRNRKGCVIVVNKWDLVEKDNNTMKEWTEFLKKKLAPFNDIPIIFTSVLSKQRIFDVLQTAIRVYESRKRRISTSALNDFLLPLIENYPPPATKGKYIKIKYVTQLPTPTPQFAFFVNLPQYIKEPYRRFLENNIRDHWDFSGVPMQIYFRQK